MEYKKCCLDCGFHFFSEENCPNCEAYETVREYEEEWDRQMSLISMYSSCMIDDDQFYILWHSEQIETKNCFRNLVQQVAPEIYEWQMSLDIELAEQQTALFNEQLDLFVDPLPF